MRRFQLLLLTTCLAAPIHPLQAPADEPPIARPSTDEDALRNSLEPPPPLPRKGTLAVPVDPLKKLQGEVDDFRKARPETAETPKPMEATPLANDVPRGPMNSLEEREKLRSRLLDLIEELRKKNAAHPPAPIPAEPHPAPESSVLPGDRLRQAQNLFRIGQVQAAQKALQLIDPATLLGKEPAMLKYMKASCHRRLGELKVARQLYGELADSKDDAFLAECANWQLQALKTREELSVPLDTSRTPVTQR